MTYEQLSITLKDTLARLKAVEDQLAEQPILRIVEALRPEPGDVVVITMPAAQHANRVMRANVAQGFQEALPGCRIAVIPDTMAVQVIGPKKSPPPPSLNMGIQRVGLCGIEDVPPRGPGFEAHDAPIRQST
jgi:hypothetical protein